MNGLISVSRLFTKRLGRQRFKNVKSANVGHYRTQLEVLSGLGISKTTLWKYRQLLTECSPDEFNHRKNEELYSPESYAALAKVRSLYRMRLSTKQIKETVIREGI